jgi:hypothetical protein
MNDIPGLDYLLKQKQRLRNLWHETRDPVCKSAVNRVVKSVRRLTRRKALQRWENKIANCENTPQAIWPIAKSLMNRDGPRAPTVINGPSGLKCHPLEKANVIAVSKISSHPIICATTTMNGGWRLQFKLYSKL